MKEEQNKKEKDVLFEKEFLPHADALYTFAFHLTYNEEDANDLVQDTFFKAYRFIDSYERGTNAKAWLFKILKNSFINEYNWGDFRGSPKALMERYFDAFLYVASWGSRQLMFRLPREQLDAKTGTLTNNNDGAWSPPGVSHL